MTGYLGDFAINSNVYMSFSTFANTGGSATATGFANTDVLVFKNGSSTSKVSSNSCFVVTDFSSQTGLHHVTIDTSDNSGDVGFYGASGDYQVAVADITVAGETVRTWLGQFSLQNRYAPAATVSGIVQANVTHVNGGAVASVIDFRANTSTLALASAVSGLNNISTADVLTQANAVIQFYDGPTKAELDSGFSGLNNISAADVLTQANAAITFYDGLIAADLPTNFSVLDINGQGRVVANVAAIGTNDVTTPNDFKADVTGIATPADVLVQANAALQTYDAPTKAELDTGFSNQNDVSVADILTQSNAAIVFYNGLVAADLPTNFSALSINGQGRVASNVVSVGTNDVSTPDDFKSGGGVVTANIAFVNGSAVTGVADFKADVSGVATPADVLTQANAAISFYDGLVAADLPTNFSALSINGQGRVVANVASIGTNAVTTPNDFKADVSGVVTPADILAQANAALQAYDAPTKAELDTGFSNLNDVSAADILTQANAAITFYDGLVAADLPTHFSALAINGQGRVVANVASIGTNAVTTPDDFKADVSGVATPANVLIQANAALQSYDAPTKAELDTGFSSLNDVSAADILVQSNAAITFYDGLVAADLPTNFNALTISVGGTVDASISDIQANSIANTVVDNINVTGVNLTTQQQANLAADVAANISSNIVASVSVNDRIQIANTILNDSRSLTVGKFLSFS